MPTKIVVTGPESTGKSILSAQLADHYRGVLVREYAREYVRELGRPYTERDMEHMARRQLELEEEALAGPGSPVICDTDLITYKIWWEVKFGYCLEWIEQSIARRPYDYHLLPDIDLAWVDDPLREHPDRRQELKGRYIDVLAKHQFPHALISGEGKERFENAMTALRKAGIMD